MALTEVSVGQAASTAGAACPGRTTYLDASDWLRLVGYYSLLQRWGRNSDSSNDVVLDLLGINNLFEKSRDCWRSGLGTSEDD